MLKCVKITSFFFVLLFELLPDTTSTVSGDCDFLRSCVNYKYIEKKKKKKKKKRKRKIKTYLCTQWLAEVWSSGGGGCKTTCLPTMAVTSCDLG